MDRSWKILDMARPTGITFFSGIAGFVNTVLGKHSVPRKFPSA